MRPEAHEHIRWGVSAVVAVAAHAAVLAYVVNHSDRVARVEPPAAVVIDLAPVAAAPAMPQTELPPGPEQPPSEEIPDQPPEQVAEEPVPPPPEPEPIPEPVQEVVPPDPVEEPPQTTQLPEPEVPLPPPPPPPAKKPETTVEPEEVKPEPPKKRPPQKPSVASAPRPLPAPAAKAAAPALSASETPSNAIPNWRSLLAAILERHKRYPPEAQSRGERGVASVQFTLDRSGNLMGVNLVRSSGSSALDQEAVALVRRAQPFPPPPPEIRGSVVTVAVPVRFSIR